MADNDLKNEVKTLVKKRNMLLIVVVTALIVVVVIGIVVATDNSDLANVEVPTLNPTVSPTRNPIELDFTTGEFISFCFIAELSAISVTEDDEPGEVSSILDASVGNIFGFFTCFDQSLVACDIDQEEFLFEGILCEVVDPTFECQCGQGILNVLLDGFFDGRSELGCGASIEDVQCNPAGDDLEAELLNLVHQQFFYYYVNDIEGDYELNENYYTFEEVQNELQDFGFFVDIEDDLVFDLIFDCEAELEFSVCLDARTLFICQNQRFVAEFCVAVDSDSGCVNPVGQIVPLEEGVLGCVLTDSPTLNPTLNPTVSPTRNPIELDFTTGEFISFCSIAELSAILATEYYEPGEAISILDASVGNIFGFFTCFDQSLVACDIDQEEFLFEGILCEAVDPTFECQCGQGVLNVLLDGFFDGRSDLGCGAFVENAQCNPAGDDLETELLNLLHQQFFYNYVNDIEGDEYNFNNEVNEDYNTFEDVQNELQDFGFYVDIEDDLVFDLIFDCEAGLEFSVCLDPKTLFICQNQGFVAELCTGVNSGFGCANLVGQIVPLEEGVLECVVTDSPTVNPTTNPTVSPTFNPTVT